MVEGSSEGQPESSVLAITRVKRLSFGSSLSYPLYGLPCLSQNQTGLRRHLNVLLFPAGGLPALAGSRPGPSSNHQGGGPSPPRRAPPPFHPSRRSPFSPPSRSDSPRLPTPTVALRPRPILSPPLWSRRGPQSPHSDPSRPHRSLGPHPTSDPR